MSDIPAQTELRRDWFAMLAGTNAEVAIATAALTCIDRLRDEYGRAAPGPLPSRYPDVRTSRA
jgi:hypothetical protein